jgi:hypothetical protein
MGFKNLGPNVSQDPQTVVPGGGQFTAEDHSFEQVVFQANKPIADWELNVQSEIFGASGQRLLTQKTLPSCFLTGDFLERVDGTGSYNFLAPDPPFGTTANQFQIVGADLNVNGWMIRFDLTESSTPGINLIQLPAPPAGSNTTRTDFVFLEVWRALIAPVPDITNKSPTGQILRYGNAKSPDGPPIGNENLADDLLDPIYAVETTRRVQIQYRYRVLSGIDLTTYADGLDSPAVFANTTPYLGGSTVDGNVTAYNYSKSSVDAGLWVAGDGTAIGAAALGTVDGFMYAIPICAVARRNSFPFNRDSNLNGGLLMTFLSSGRPDGLFADQIIASDVRDMRKTVAKDWTEILDKMMQEVFDNTLSTNLEVTATGPGGTSVLAKADVGVLGHTGNPDGIRRYFSDRSITETIVARVDIIGATSSVNIDLSNLTLAWASSPFSVNANSPSGTNLVSVNKVHIVDYTANTETDALSLVTPLVSSITYSINVGPALDRATIAFSSPQSSVSVFVELAIEYPAGFGVGRNMAGVFQVWAYPLSPIPAWVDSSTWTPTSDPNRYAIPSTFWSADFGHRELGLHLKTLSQSAVFNTIATNQIYIWERLTGDPITINDGINLSYTTTNYTVNTAYTIVTLTGAMPVPSGTAVHVTYLAFRAFPLIGLSPFDSFQIFYQSQAVQSLAVPAGTNTLNLIPRAVSKNLYVMTTGSGSPDQGFPFSAPGVQIPVGSLPPSNYPESRLDTPNFVGLPGFGVNTGFVQIPVFVPYVPNPAQVTLYSSGGDATIDGDNRNFWPRSDSGAIPLYTPSAYAQPLMANQRHKVAMPVLMELKQDFESVGRKGTLVLVMVTRWIEFDSQNNVTLSSTPSDSCAAVYRIRGNMLNSRRSDT